MPQYDYRCERCHRRFSVRLTITEHEKRAGRLRCPRCGSRAVRHLIESVFVTTARKS